jgi:hypothetical protein
MKMIAQRTVTWVGQRIGEGIYHPTWYVSDLPGHAGNKRITETAERNSDWGYTSDRAKALPLSVYWQRRFAADMRRVGGVFQLSQA